MSYEILHPGPPPLTVDAADAGLDMIDMIAAIVRGVDLIDVTNTVRPLWRAHLAAWYPSLPPMTRNWYATAPQVFTSLRTQWPTLAPWQQGALVQQWSYELPQMLAMLDPVLAQAQALDAQPAVQAHLQSLRGAAAPAPAPPVPPEAQAVVDYAREQQMTRSLINYSNSMTTSTIDLMRSWSGR